MYLPTWYVYDQSWEWMTKKLSRSRLKIVYKNVSK